MEGTVTVPMGLRTHEKQQLERHVPNIIDYLEDIGLGAVAEDLEDVTIEFEPNDEPGFRHLARTTADEWRMLVRGLQHQDGLDVWWLRKKLARRLYQRTQELQEDADAE